MGGGASEKSGGVHPGLWGRRFGEVVMTTAR